MEKKKVAKVGIPIAAVLGLALVAGSTSAMWQDSETVHGGDITSGNLEISSLQQDGNLKMLDGSLKPISEGVSLVPGDEVQFSNSLDMALEGDSLRANLDSSQLEKLIPDSNKKYVKISNQLVDSAGKEVSPNSNNDFEFQSENGGSDTRKALPKALDGKEDYVVKTTVIFDRSTPDQVLTDTDLTEMSKATATLKQVKS